MKGVYLLTGILCFIGILSLPIGYYTFLRIVVCVTSFIFVYQDFQKKGVTFLVIIFALIGILFNPIIPVYLYDKGIWIIIDVIVGILFTALFFTSKKLIDDK